MLNMDIRLEAKGAGVTMWRIAEYLGISEPTLTRKLRKELTEEEKTEFRKIISELKAGC